MRSAKTPPAKRRPARPALNNGITAAAASVTKEKSSKVAATFCTSGSSVIVFAKVHHSKVLDDPKCPVYNKGEHGKNNARPSVQNVSYAGTLAEMPHKKRGRGRKNAVRRVRRKEVIFMKIQTALKLSIYTCIVFISLNIIGVALYNKFTPGYHLGISETITMPIINSVLIFLLSIFIEKITKLRLDFVWLYIPLMILVFNIFCLFYDLISKPKYEGFIYLIYLINSLNCEISHFLFNLISKIKPYSLNHIITTIYIVLFTPLYFGFILFLGIKTKIRKYILDVDQ